MVNSVLKTACFFEKIPNRSVVLYVIGKIFCPACEAVRANLYIAQVYVSETCGSISLSYGIYFDQRRQMICAVRRTGFLHKGGAFMENHTVTIENRDTVTVTDIREIDSFDEDEVRATLGKGAMIIKGSGLHIHMLDLNEGRAVVTGTVDSLMYVKVREKGEKGFFARLMK